MIFRIIRIPSLLFFSFLFLFFFFYFWPCFKISPTVFVFRIETVGTAIWWIHGCCCRGRKQQQQTRTEENNRHVSGSG
ncbi:hypothetical protein ASPWEDRAFT_707031 [Aspergillus wentii DTO 134E9]|uniref:Uncharacterized protein n=1 Tax=Aspergillus wentii DTO 134E9 TaxID=1073089 RepID=A0A1L9R600_ASPWE|nr:uncharacterized protein ASPWEDRAFT_707031 [Aspergillus wentii DTO 134E9]OJJ30346.1 hypothetical protein ASPWEDRAFT_707031 [Aspergillus wentii DTO 134E9]